MNLDEQHHLKYNQDEAKALKEWLVWVISHKPESVYDQMIFCLLGRVITKIYKRTMLDVNQGVSFKVNEEQNIALQLVMQTYPWPNNFIDFALNETQRQLPPRIFANYGGLQGHLPAPHEEE